MIGERKVFREDAEIADGQTIIFTGAVYLREASGLEIWVGGSQDHIYYEVRLNQQLWMLDLTGFDAPPFDFCL